MDPPTRLFQPIRIGGIELPNRVKMPALVIARLSQPDSGLAEMLASLLPVAVWSASGYLAGQAV